VARKALDADIAAALDLVIWTAPLSDETRQRIAELSSAGGDANEILRSNHVKAFAPTEKE